MSPSRFNKFIEEHAGSYQSLVVPLLVDGNLRIKVVSKDEFNKASRSATFERATGARNQFLFGYESPNLDKCPGVLVSAWSLSDLVTPTKLSYKYPCAAADVYGKGYGARDRSDCLGLNVYRSMRLTNRPHPTPFIADEDISKHQYYTQGQRQALLQPFLEKKLHQLTESAKQLFQKEH
jgi:hypothetical protein